MSEERTSNVEEESLDKAPDTREANSLEAINIHEEKKATELGEGEENGKKESSPLESDEDSPQIKSKEGESDDTKASKQSRELKSILALSKEANLDTNIVHKRKSTEPSKTQSKVELQKGMASSAVESPQTKRAMRSQNPEFVIKHQKFLSKIVSHGGESPPELSDDEKKEVRNTYKKSVKKVNSSETVNIEESFKMKNFKILKIDPNKNKDIFCWRCHKGDVIIFCETCPRSYHTKCLKQAVVNPQRWVCPECVAIMKAESVKERSPAMRGMSLEHLCGLLKFALKRMMQVTGSEPFLHPVSEKDFPEYKNYIIQPMDLTRLEKSIKENLYGSTQAFEADAKWILHNSMIFNTAQAKLTTIAKNILKVCKQEMSEIENCASCYLNANTKKDSWFVEVCPKPHLLVWAKLKGFPYWPAKAMRTNSLGMVDVRFFGAHDRAWVPDKECFLYSLKDPNCNKQKRNDIAECIKELEVHIDNLKKVYGEFCYAPYRTPLEPSEEIKQLQMLLPQYNPDTSPLIGWCSRKKEEADVGNGDSRSSCDSVSPSPAQGEAVFFKEKDSDKMSDGYGSEDDDMEPRLDEKRRKKMAENNVEEYNDDIVNNMSPKEDEDFETQINSNSIVEKHYRSGSVRMRGGCTNSTGKLKIIPRQTTCTEEMSRKRMLAEELLSEPLQKLPRRNSDLSVKSDSSRVSNLSDKINRVDISENMEISLGNDDTGNISISEVISSDFSESSTKSDNVENILESRRKPVVQVNISGNENKEFTISPQNKVSIVDRLMQRLTQNTTQQLEEIDTILDSYPTHENINDTKRDLFSRLDSERSGDLKEKEPKTGQEKSTSTDQGSNLNVMPQTSSTVSSYLSENKNNADVITQEKDYREKKEQLGLEESSSNKPLPEKINISNTDCFRDELPSEILNVKEVNLNSEQNSQVSSENALYEEQEKNILKENNIQDSQNEHPTPSSGGVKITTTSNASLKADSNSEPEKEVLNSKSIANDSDEDDVFEETEEISPVKLNENFFKDIIHSSLNVAKPLKQNCLQDDTVQCDVINNKSIPSETCKPMKVKADHGEENSTGTSKKRKLSINNNEFTDEKQLQKEPLKVVNIKKLQDGHITSIESSESKKKPTSVEKQTDKTPNLNIPLSAEKETLPSINEKEKGEQQKHNDVLPNLQQKPKEILQESPDKISHSLLNTSQDATQSTLKSILESISSGKSAASASIELDSITIKSEPSSDEEPGDVEYMEAKRKYMSALNISEKDKMIEKAKRHEIRTRSKTEERSKLPGALRDDEKSGASQSGRKEDNTSQKSAAVDNISKVINDVASHYSAEHEGEEIAIKSLKEKKKEFLVRPFVPLSKQQRARKSFPSPSATISAQNVYHGAKKEAPKVYKIASTCSTCASTDSVVINTPSFSAAMRNVSNSKITDVSSYTTSIPSTGITVAASAAAALTTTVAAVTTATTTSASIMLVSQQPILNSLAILPPNQQITYTPSIGNPILTMVQHPNSTATLNSVIIQSNVKQPLTNSVISAQSLSADSGTTESTMSEMEESQNYIPQSGASRLQSLCSAPVTTSISNMVLPVMLNANVSDPKTPHILNTLPSLAPLSSTTGQRRIETVSLNYNNNNNNNNNNSNNSNNCAANNDNNSTSSNNIEGNNAGGQNEDFGFLAGTIPESLSQAVGEIMARGIPKLKPKPPGPLGVQFDEGLPSSAGPVASKVNSISHRLADYLRGMLIELLKELGSADNAEAEIVRLKLENEELRHKHAEEMLEIKRNIGSILRDIQKSIADERNKVVEETRTLCEAETIKRVEEAKSKQWCANCFKEAQFYCCWNTSYCDYPCQQKHWLKHMSKCTQNQQQNQSTNASPKIPNQTIMLRPSNPVNRFPGKSFVAKPTKVYVNRGNLKNNPQSIIKTSTSNQITLVESSPGNYELLGNGTISVGGKLLTNPSLVQKLQKGNVINVSAPPSSSSSSSSILNAISRPSTILTQSRQTHLSSSSKNLSLFSDDSD